MFFTKIVGPKQQIDLNKNDMKDKLKDSADSEIDEDKIYDFNK